MSTIKKLFLLLLVGGILAMFGVKTAEAGILIQPNPSHCPPGWHWDMWQWKCVPNASPTPLPTRSPKPTCSPTSTPTPTPTETPTATPSATPEPTITPTPGPSEPTNQYLPEAPKGFSCGDVAPVLAVMNFHIYRNGDDAIAKWVPTDGDKAHIYYKEPLSPVWQHAARDIQNTGYYEIHDLGSADWTFALQQANGCAGGLFSYDVVDVATNGWVLFH